MLRINTHAAQCTKISAFPNIYQGGTGDGGGDEGDVRSGRAKKIVFNKEVALTWRVQDRTTSQIHHK